MMEPQFSRDVFINCPFDKDYKNLFHAIAFTVMDCGFKFRCALEIEDGTETRIDKIYRIIRECPYGIHDISRTELDKINGLPRFNMPFELGLFMGAKRFGDRYQKKKMCLIIDHDLYRYQKFISDIAGQDIQSHQNTEDSIIEIVRNWLQNILQKEIIPTGKVIKNRFLLFKNELFATFEILSTDAEKIPFIDYRNFVEIWIKSNP